MASINSTHLLGNLTRDPEVRYTPKGSAVCDISLALNRVWYDEQNQKHEECDFIDVTIFGKSAENLGKYVGKGCRLHVQGRLKQETWEDKATGQKKSKVKVIADSVTYIDFIERGEPQPAQQAPAPRQPAQRQAGPAPAGYGKPQAARTSRTVQYRQPEPDDGGEIPF